VQTSRLRVVVGAAVLVAVLTDVLVEYVQKPQVVSQ